VLFGQEFAGVAQTMGIDFTLRAFIVWWSSAGWGNPSAASILALDLRQPAGG
jgi:hypothetical protein